MKHGPLLPLPSTVPVLDDGRNPNILLRAAQVETLSRDENETLCSICGIASDASVTLWEALDHRRQLVTRGMIGAHGKRAGALYAHGYETLTAGGLPDGASRVSSPALHSHAQLATWAAWCSPLTSDDFMASCAGVHDAAACLALAARTGDKTLAAAAAALPGMLASPGYHGPSSEQNGHDLLRLYAGREGEAFALSVAFEPDWGDAYVLASPDADGVPTAYAALKTSHVAQAVRALARQTRAEVSGGDTANGHAWRLTW